MKKTRTRIGSILMSLALILSLLPVTAMAGEPGDEPGTEDDIQTVEEESPALLTLTGAGTEADPYQVSTAEDLTDALAAGGYIQLRGSFEVSTSATTAVDTAVVLDLNSETVTWESSAKEIIKVQHGGNLTIQDATDRGSLKFTSTYSSTSNYGISVFTDGSLTFTGGTISYQHASKSGGAIYTNINADFTMTGGTVQISGASSYAMYLSASGLHEITGGQIVFGEGITASTVYGVYAIILSADNPAGFHLSNLTVDGSAVPEEKAVICVRGYNSSTPITISSGTYTANSNKNSYAVGAGSGNKTSISGGTFTGPVKAAVGKITGGTFSVQPSANYIATGKIFELQDDGYYHVVDGSYAGRIGDVGYMTWDELFEAVPEGKNTTIYILSDANEITVPEGKNVTFYNSKKLSVGKLTNNGTCKVLTYPLSGTEVVNNGTFSLDHEVGSLINNESGVVNATANSPKVTGALTNHGTMTISKGSYLGALTNDGTLTITGGTFQTDVKNLCAEGYTTQQNKEGTWDVMQDVTHVAEIDGYWYGTLQAAMSAAQNGDTVVLLSDTTLNSEVKVSNKTLTLDMNGHTITYGASGNYYGAMSFMGASDITITGNGSFDFNADYMGENSKSHGRIFDVENSAVLTIENGTFHAGLVCVRADNVAKVIIKGGSYYASKQYGDGVWWHLNLQDGSDAKFYVYGGTFANYDPSNSATENPEDNFCAEGYTVTSETRDDGITYYTVVPDSAQSFAAQIGALQYVSLDKAIEAAKNGDTITLLQKYEGSPVAISKAIMIDLGSTDTESSQFTAADGYAMAADGTTIRFVRSYTVTFDPTGGTVDPDNGTTDAYGKLAELPTPTRENYRFNGWYTAESGGQNVTTETVFTVNSTVYAQWTFVPPTVDVSAVTLDRSELTLAIGATTTLKATVSPDDATNSAVTWSSSAPGIAAVDQDGNVTAVALGTVNITATSVVDPTKSAACEVTVTYADVTSVTLNETILNLTKGDSTTLTATVVPATADQTVIWASSNPDIATVDKSGTVTAVGVGEATITATAGDQEAVCTVTVSYAKVASITLDTTELTLVKDGITTLTAKVEPDAADQTVTWSSSAPEIVTVDQSGNVKAVGIGVAIITATSQADSTKFAACEVIVTAPGDVIPSVEPSQTDVSNIDQEDQGTATTVAESVAADTTITDAAQSAANELDRDPVTQGQLKQEAENQGLDTEEGQSINLFTQTFLSIQADALDKDEDDKVTSITLNITPMVQIVASTADSVKDIELITAENPDGNAVVVQTATELTITAAATITVHLPNSFAGKTAYVEHKAGDENTYFYMAEYNFATGEHSFTSYHGFSPFTFSLENGATAEVNGIGYATLKDAVNNASNKDTIILNRGSDEKVTVQRSVTFTLDKSGHNFTGTISAGAGYEMTTVTNEGKITYTFTRISTGGSGSSGVSGDYIISVDKPTGGKVTVNPGRADKGDEVTITAIPNDGYVLQSLTVTDKDGDTVRVSSEGRDKYTFTMPGSTVTVKAVFAPEGSAVVTPEISFTDVAENFWAYNEIQWAAENGYMTGTTATTFNPNGTVTRQQVWMILARMAGANPADMAAAKAWAVNNSISDGTNPGGAVTRQQLVALLYRFAGQYGYDVSAKADLSGYPDVASLASYAADAMAWSVANGIIGGTTAGTLNPAGTANRAQFAVILWRFYQTTAV